MTKKKKSFTKRAETSRPTLPQTLPKEDEFPTLGSVPGSQPSTSQTNRPLASDDPIGSSDISNTIIGSEPTLPTQPTTSGPQTVPISSPSEPIAGPSGQTEPTSDTPKKKSEEIKDLSKEIKENLRLIPRPQHRQFPKRPDSLTDGYKVVLLTNHFLLKVGSKQAFHYDLEIERAPKVEVRDTNVVDRDVEESTAETKRTQYSRKIATKLNRKIFEQMVKTFSQNQTQEFYGIHPIYDGQKNMFVSKILKETGGQARPGIRLKVELTDEGRNSVFYVNIRLTETNSTIDLNLLNAYHSGQTCDDEVVKKSILFINTLLRHNATMNWIPIGQSIFDPKVPGQAIGNYLSLCYGYYTSVRNLMAGPTYNVDRSAGAFYNPSIGIDKIIGFIIRGNLTAVPVLNNNQIRIIKKELSGLQVEATHVKYGNYYRKYRVLGISKLSAKEIKFEWIEKDMEGNDLQKGTVSVADYFRQKYRQPLKYPQLPCLEVGNPNKKTYLPIEVCRLLSHQRLRRSLTNEERSKMTEISGQQKPRDRLDMSRRYVNEQFITGGMAQKNRPFLSEFEIDVSNDFLRVDSKVINPPVLKYMGNRSVTPASGEWEMYKSNLKFLRTVSLQNWIIINISFSDINDETINAFSKDMCDQALEMGLSATAHRFSAKISSFEHKITFKGIQKNIKALETKWKTKIQMILFFTPLKTNSFSDEIYSEIKLLGDVQNGWPTQCVNISNVWPKKGRFNRWNRSYLRQLMLKVNPKLGGINVALMDSSAMPSIFRNYSKSLMIVGADVNHPAPADRISPSIAAIVSSYDNEFSNYYTTVSMQPKSREEMIKHLDKMVFECLKNYRTKNNRLPERIVFYRDGVSDGQFQHVIDNEYPLLLNAFKQIGAKNRPKITFIVVQKRHHTRFATEKGENVKAGTVVDTGVTHKTDFDFYLCSHTGRIGTSRSAHYYVLADENGFNTNDMCKMTYYLCHIYQRCTKSVSIPAPVYYADLAAYRAKVHASVHYADYRSDGRSVMSGSGDDLEEEESQIKTCEDMIKVNDNQKQRLYFC